MATSSVADSAARVNDSGRPDQTRTIIRTVIVAWLVMLLGVGIPLSLYMDSWVGGFAVSFFTALFGGPGFGLMAGMAVYNLNLEKWEKKHPEFASH